MNAAFEMTLKPEWRTTRTITRKPLNSILRAKETVTVLAYYPAKGYGFAVCNNETSVYFSKNVLDVAGIKSIFPNDRMIVDLVKPYAGGKEDQLRVSKVHSASEHVQKEFSTTGTVLMFNGTYGFIQPSSLCSNAYVKAADGSTKLENIYVDIQALKDNKLVTLDRNQEVKVTFFRNGPRFFAKKIETIRR